MKIIGIDIGTTSICAVVTDADSGELIESVSAPNRAFIASDKPFEKIQDPAVIMSTVRELISRLGTLDAAAIGFSGQMHGILYTDSCGNAVSPLYIWQDERAAQPYKDGKTYAEYLGCFPGYGLATDFYNEVNGLIPDDAEYLCAIADYAIMQLCGNSKPVMHITNAASLGCFDVKPNRFTLKNDRLPEVTTKFKAVGKCKGIPLCVALGDNQASFIGSVREPSDALLNVGTGAQISWLTDNADGSGVEIRAFDGKRYLAAGCSLCGGRAFAMVEKLFRSAAQLAGAGCDSFYPMLDRLLVDKTATDLVADCRFCGTRSDPTVRGAFSSVSESNFTVGDIALAVMNGMVAELHDMYTAAGGDARGIVCSGNGVRRNPALQRVISSAFDSAIKIPRYEEEAAYGAALAASVACGINADIDSARSKIKYTGE